MANAPGSTAFAPGQRDERALFCSNYKRGTSEHSRTDAIRHSPLVSLAVKDAVNNNKKPASQPSVNPVVNPQPTLCLVALALLALKLAARYLQGRPRRNHSTQQIRFPHSPLAVQIRSLQHCPHRSRRSRQISHHPAHQTRSLPRTRMSIPLHQLRTFLKSTTQPPLPRSAGLRVALNTSVKLLPRISPHCPKAGPKYRSWTINLLRPMEDLPAMAFRGKASRSGKRM